MSTIAENLQSIIDSKNDIKNALIEKKSAPTGGLITYADAIRNITSTSSFNFVMDNNGDIEPTILLDGVDVTESIISGDAYIINNISGDIHILFNSRYSIIYETNGCELTNKPSKIIGGSNFNTTIVYPEGNEIKDITVRMGSVDITNESVSGNEISVSDVSAVIYIFVLAGAKTFTVTNNLNNYTISNSETVITYGDAYSATITPNTYYHSGTLSISMGGVDISDSSIVDNVITIEKVTGDIVISGEAENDVYTVTVNGLTNATIDNLETSINGGEPYIATIVPYSGFKVDNLTVTMGGVEVETLNNKIEIDAVNGPINIEVVIVENVINEIGYIDENSSNAIVINDGVLNSGIYTLVYEDENDNELSSMNKITEFTI